MGGQQLRYRQAIEALSHLGPVTLLLLRSARVVDGAADAAPLTIEVDPEVPRRGLYRWSAALGSPAKKLVRARLRARFQLKLQQSLDAILAQSDPDIVVVESPELMPYLPPLAAPGRYVIYDAHNVEKVLWGDFVALRGRLGVGIGRAAFRERVLAGEASLATSADQVWTCSENDARLFAAVYPGSRAEIKVVPNAVDAVGLGAAAAQRHANAGKEGQPPRVLYTANFGYAPNLEAARILLDEIRPRLLAAVPSLQVVLCGQQPPPELQALAASEPDVVVTGAVPDVRPWFAAAGAVIVPLRHGGGTRLKILEALAAGCPLVSTHKGAEGLQLDDGLHLRLAETAHDLAEALLWCLREPEMAQAMAERGRARVAELYSWEANEARVREIVSALSRQDAQSRSMRRAPPPKSPSP
jgi:glycosyltransferase involved in cell wall biosynthesis